jgi:hypothetical protein
MAAPGQAAVPIAPALKSESTNFAARYINAAIDSIV